MKELINKLIYWYVDKARMWYTPNPKRFPIGTSVTRNWLARVYLDMDEQHFIVKGYYECGIITQDDDYIADYWLKEIKPITHQEQQ